MRDPPIQPRQRQALERPANRDPLFFSCSGIATVTNASAAPATSANRPRSLCPAGSSARSDRNSTASTAPSTTGTTPIIQSRPPATNAARAPKNAIALAAIAAKYGSRLSFSAPANDKWIGDEYARRARPPAPAAAATWQRDPDCPATGESRATRARPPQRQRAASDAPSSARELARDWRHERRREAQTAAVRRRRPRR